MAWTFVSDKPVFIQIGEHIKRSIVSGEYPPGSQIPPVRQIAVEATVNPNTVQHAFAVLEHEGLIISKGTMGKFVTDNTEIIEECQRKMAQKIVESFFYDMENLGFSEEEALKIINKTQN